jgi:Zn ribbon nucleic-acid-binding protein
MINDQLSTCPKCKSEEACYIVEIEKKNNSYSCMNCGFATNDYMIEGEYDVEKYEEELPQIYRDIKYTDENKRVWYPLAVNVDSLGTVFAMGKSDQDWTWSAIKATELTKEDREKKFFKGKKYKSDPSTMKNFGKDGFYEACDYIKMFD